jgi:ABC-type nitrate/sulfonate/bicarbonate transport system substrate-binding protein
LTRYPIHPMIHASERHGDHGRIAMRIATIVLVLAVALGGFAARADEARELRIGYGFGIGFLPLMVIEKLHLVDKHSKAATGEAVTTTFTRFSGSAAMQDAVLSGAIDMGGYGVPALLIAWEKTRGTAREIMGLCGITTGKLVLVTNNPAVASIKDLGPSDRIAMPATISPQMYVLQMAAEKEFGAGAHDRFKSAVVSLPHPEAVKAILARLEITAYFSSAPFTQIVLRDPGVRPILDSETVFGGKGSFLVMAMAKRFADKNPGLVKAALAAIEEADAVIKEDPHRAAEIYLSVEPSSSMTVDFIEGILKSSSDDFGAEVHGVKAYADALVRLGQLHAPPASWRDVFHSILGARDGS